MTLVKSIDSVVDWLQQNVCQQITFKLPDDDRNDASNNVEFVHPVALPLFTPGKEYLPPSVPAPIPSVCVQLLEGADDLLKKQRRLNVRLCLACWNPGLHSDELLNPTEDANALMGFSYSTENKDAMQKYARNMNGWRDTFNFLDLVLRELEGTEYINGLRLVKEADIKYGVFNEDGHFIDYYPYWISWVSFTLEAGVVVKPLPYEDLL